MSLHRFKVEGSWGVHVSVTAAAAHGATGLPLEWTKPIPWTKEASRRENGSWWQPSPKGVVEIPHTWLSRWSHRKPGSLGSGSLTLVPNVS